MAQHSEIVNTTLISQIGLYLNLVFRVRSAILMRRAHEKLLHQKFTCVPFKEKANVRKVKTSTAKTIY